MHKSFLGPPEKSAFFQKSVPLTEGLNWVSGLTWGGGAVDLGGTTYVFLRSTCEGEGLLGGGAAVLLGGADFSPLAGVLGRVLPVGMVLRFSTSLEVPPSPPPCFSTTTSSSSSSSRLTTSGASPPPTFFLTSPPGVAPGGGMAPVDVLEIVVRSAPKLVFLLFYSWLIPSDFFLFWSPNSNRFLHAAERLCLRLLWTGVLVLLVKNMFVNLVIKAKKWV